MQIKIFAQFLFLDQLGSSVQFLFDTPDKSVITYVVVWAMTTSCLVTNNLFMTGLQCQTFQEVPASQPDLVLGYANVLSLLYGQLLANQEHRPQKHGSHTYMYFLCAYFSCQCLRCVVICYHLCDSPLIFVLFI